MNITSFGIYFAISLCILSVALIAYNSCIEGQNLILIIISLELFLLSIGVLLVHFSFILDDIIGSVITLYL
jgi:NADH:ubiquinone oxidoreductase subunit K